MFSRITKIYADRQARLSRQDPLPEGPIQNEQIIQNAPETTGTGATAATEEVKNTEFEPVERQRHFGILHYTMNNRFKKIMLVALANILLILSFFLFMFFFMMKYRCGDTQVTVVPCETTTMMTTTTPMVSTTTITPHPPTCTNGFELVGQKCWKIDEDNDVKSRKVTEEKCRAQGAPLFMLKSAEEDQVFSVWMNHRHHRTWMGLLCKTADNSSCMWDDQSKWPFEYSAFAEGSPDPTLPCIYYNVTGPTTRPWTSGDCSLALSYVCELPTTIASDCKYNYNKFCYYLNDTLATFSEAQDYCRNQCGNLVSVDSYLEYIYLSSIEGAENQKIYLGGIVISKTNILWTDGSSRIYNNLQNYNEKDSCLSIDIGSSGNNGNWSTVPCTSKLKFICKIPIDNDCNKV